MLEGFKFRKLENGYTVKYHIADPERPAGTPPRFGGELYVTDKENLKACIASIVERWLENDPPQVVDQAKGAGE